MSTVPRVVREWLRKIGRRGGKRSKRVITSEQQAKMQAGRKRGKRRVVALLAAVLPCLATARTIPVYVTFGGSNEFGFNAAPLDVFGRYVNANPDVLFTLRELYYEQYSDFQSQPLHIVSERHFSSEMLCGWEIDSRFKSHGVKGPTLAWVKASCDGTVVTNWLPGAAGYSALSNGIMRATNYIYKVLHCTPQVVWISMLQQGRSMHDAAIASNYVAILSQVVSGVRRLTGGNPHFAVVRANDDYGMTWRPFYGEVRQGAVDAAVVIENCSWIDTDGMETHDGIHYTGAGLLAMSRARLENITAHGCAPPERFTSGMVVQIR